VRKFCGMTPCHIPEDLDLVNSYRHSENSNLVIKVPFSRIKKSKALEDGTDSLSGDVGTELPLYTAQYCRKSANLLCPVSLSIAHLFHLAAQQFG
jgi:hypothetical protein